MRKLSAFSLLFISSLFACAESFEGIITGVKEVTESCGVDSGKLCRSAQQMKAEH